MSRNVWCVVDNCSQKQNNQWFVSFTYKEYNTLFFSRNTFNLDQQIYCHII